MEIRRSYYQSGKGSTVLLVQALSCASLSLQSRCPGTVSQEKRLLRQFRRAERYYQGTSPRHILSSH
jgi:hypothetical protein